MTQRENVPELAFEGFLTYQDVSAFCAALAEARPGLCRLTALGRSREGREIQLLTITDYDSGAPEDKPAYLIHGNIHAGELSGTQAALYTARQLLLDAPGSDLLQRIVFYVVPRINPDGAEFAATTMGRVRSRTDRSERVPNTLYQEDVDGNGLVLTIRQAHPDGEYAVDLDDPRLMIRRKADSRGPFYRQYPEGTIFQWDGSDRIAVEGRRLDWNRNWSYDWRPEPEQPGAGDFPFSEIEMRHMVTFIHSRPNLFGVLGYHTGPAAVLRPPSTGALDDLDREDDQVMEDLARIGARETGFPVMPVIKYHGERSRDINLRGHFHSFGYHHLGLYVFEFELGTMYNSAGLSTEEIMGSRTDEEHEAQTRQVLRWWDGREPGGPLYAPWAPFDHPQFGQVEIGGAFYPRWANPTQSDLSQIAVATYRFTLEHAGRHPYVVLEDLSVTVVGKTIYRIRARVANRGAFPTHVTVKGQSLSRLRPVRVEFHPAAGVELLSLNGHVDVGHLDGVTGSRSLEWFVSAPETSQQALCEIRVLGGTGGNVCREVGRPT